MRKESIGSRQALVTLTAAAMSLSLLACAASPRRVARVSDEEEVSQGRDVAQQVEQQIGFAGHAELSAYVSRVGQRLVKHSARSHLEHHFRVVDMAEPNAFALPGGYIYVSRGLLALMNSEDELATVLGHEIGHVAARHSVQQQVASRSWVPLQILAGLGGAAASVVSPTLGSVVAATGQLPAALAMASYSRQQEEEADRLGQQYAAAEGWDPAALASCMDTLTREQELDGGRDPNRKSFFDSHPTTPNRAREGREYAATLERAPADRITVDRTAFVQQLDGLALGKSVRAGLFLDQRFVHPELGFALDFPRSWEHENGPVVVLAQPQDGSALLALQLAAEGEDPVLVADRFEEEIPLLERSGLQQINGMPAVAGLTKVSVRGQELVLSLTWIAKDGLVYQLLGAASSDRWQEHRRSIEASAQSFRQVSKAELREVTENRLRLVRARPGETLSQIAARSGSEWPTKKMAVANGLANDAKLSGSEPIKISKKEPYAP